MVSKPSIPSLKDSVSERVGSTGSLMNDARGEVGADILKITIVLVLGVTFVANALPPALTTWVNSTPTGLGAGAEAMWTLGPLAIVAGIVIYFVATMFGMEKVEDFLN